MGSKLVLNEIKTIEIGNGSISWSDVANIAKRNFKLVLSEKVKFRIKKSREFVDQIAEGDELHYGINSGLGALCNVRLNKNELADLSFHTLMSHACGVGAPFNRVQVRAIMCAAVVNYSHGFSGINSQIVDRLITFLNEGITPIVPAQGSVGYLIHMAHIGLALIGVGDVEFNGETVPSLQAMAALGLEPITLGPKDGLSLVNGTPSMTGLACLCLDEIQSISLWADIAAAMSFEALNGQKSAFSKPLMQLKAYVGMQATTHNLEILLRDSQHLNACEGQHLQDALSLRSTPHVHGACRDQFDYAADQINRELNSVSDNPIVMEENGVFSVHSQAHAHGESVAMACDMLAIAVCEWSSIAERRLHRLVNPAANTLPNFLTRQSGVKSGMMIAQYTAASLAADNKRLAVPAVIDNYITSGVQEDHLSFGESSAIKLGSAIDNCLYILAIELIFSAQAFDLIESKGFGLGTDIVWKKIRQQIAFYEETHPLSQDIESVFSQLKEKDFLYSIMSEIKNLEL